MRCVRACLLIGILNRCPKHKTNAIRSFLPSRTNNLQDSCLFCDEKLGTFCGDELVWQFVFVLAGRIKKGFWRCALVSAC